MLPNVIRGVQYRILNRTSADNRISVLTLPATPVLPHVLIRDDGGIPEPSDNRSAIKRVTFECRATSWEAALSLALQVRDLWRPPEEIVDGWHGDVTVPAIPARGIPEQTIHFSGASVNAEPVYVPDEVAGTPRYNLPILITYS